MTADVVGLYPSIPHKAGLQALKNALEKREQKHIPTEKLINMAEFVLKNNFFEFNGSAKQVFRNDHWYKVCSLLMPVHIWMM